MILEWNGHACFTVITDKGTRILTDPYDPSVGYRPLNEQADYVLVSHHHHDHDCLEGVIGAKRVFDTVTDIQVGDITVTSLECFHDESNGTKRGRNLIFKLIADGQTLVHMGDIGHYPTEAQLEFISGADALLLPIGGFYTVDTATALKIAAAAAPKAVIPMHYRNDRCAFPISDETEFARVSGAQRPGTCRADIASLAGTVILEHKY